MNSILDLMARHAAERGDHKAFTFLPERGAAAQSLTFAELDRRARGVAATLLERARPGDRAVLMFLPGLDILVALFGCLAAGIIAVPLMLPRRAATRDATLDILQDCATRLLLTGADVVDTRRDVIERYQTAFDWMTVDAAQEYPAPAALPRPSPSDVALLQYTSGSTSTPKGVMVGHANLLANLTMTQTAWDSGPHSTTVGWIPLYHDMGLILGVMYPLFLGAHSVLMPPASFMQRPLSWLRAITLFRAELTAAPNFAFDLCAQRLRPEQAEGLDLSSLKVAMCAAEPVRADTMRRFTAAFAPYGLDPAAVSTAYGLAEATLIVSGARTGRPPASREVSRAALQSGRVIPSPGPADHQAVVACGRALIGEEIAIVDPARLERVEPGSVGEIWACGPHITQGYWRNPEATAATFHAHLADTGDRPWLRTGDLGFVDADGAVYVTGRIKDLIIIRGANHYPQDIERTVQAAHPALSVNGGVAFAHTGEDGTEQLVVVQEVARVQRHTIDLEQVAAQIKAAVAAEHEIAVHHIALIAPATLPKTTSGKVQRNMTRRLWLDGALEHFPRQLARE